MHFYTLPRLEQVLYHGLKLGKKAADNFKNIFLKNNADFAKTMKNISFAK